MLIALMLMAATVSPVAPPEVVTFSSGSLALKAQLWRPAGKGPFPMLVFNHGLGKIPPGEPLPSFPPVFTAHGYAVLIPFRRGHGLSPDAGPFIQDRLARAEAERGPGARAALLLELVEGEQLDDVLAALAYAQARPDVDRRRIAVAGHSLGGMLTVLAAARAPGLCAAIDMSGGGGNWDRAPGLRDRLIRAVAAVPVPVFFFHAENDLSTGPGRTLSAEMARLGKPQQLKIYPPFGSAPREGHSFGVNGVEIWGPDALRFLDRYCPVR